MMRPIPVRSGTAMLVAALAGCASPPSTTLTLDVAPPRAETVRAGYAGPPVAIPAVHVPAAIDRVEVVRQVAAGQVEIDDFARWSAPLGTLARDALVRDLIARLPSGSVLPPGTAGSGRRATTIDVTILSYDAIGPGAKMQAAYRILPGGTTRLVTLETSPGGEQPATVATKWSDLIGRLSDRITDDLGRGLLR